jgi:hypothetical protein
VGEKKANPGALSRFPLCLMGLLFLAAAVYGEPDMKVRGSLQWDTMELNARITLDLASAGIRLPTGRNQAEELIAAEYPSLLQPLILSIPVDSSDTIGDLVNRGVFSLRETGDMAIASRKIAPALSADLRSLAAGYTIALDMVSAAFVQHSRPAELFRTLSPVPSASYTGIIIIAREALPIHGRNTASVLLPCLFPKIWDTDMNLIYERNHTDPRIASIIVRYAREESIFRPTPSGLSAELESLVGSNPLRIFARGVFGVRPTDPIIDREDALAIISSENNRRLLREGRVALIVPEAGLSVSF